MAFIPAAFAAIGSFAGAAGAGGALATGLSVASTALGVLGSIKQGQQASAAEKSAANMADYNAKVADIRAQQAGVETNMREDEQRRRARMAIGQQIAASGEAGAGLNPDLLRQSIYDGEFDTSSIRYEGALKTAGFTDEAKLQRSGAAQHRSNASQAMTGGILNAGTTLLKGATYWAGGKSLNPAATGGLWS